MPHSLDSCWAKIDRAKEALHSLNAELTSFLSEERSPYRVKRTIHLGTNKYAFSALGPPVPLRYSVLTGEIIHHLRSSLDHLIWAMLARNTSNPRRVHFPVCDTREAFDKACRSGAIEGVQENAYRKIEAFQPYHMSDARKSALYQIHALNNADKHRSLLIAVAAIQRGTDITIDPGSDNISLLGIHEPSPSKLVSEDGTEILAFHFDKVDPCMNIDVDFRVEIVLQDLGEVLGDTPLLQVLAFFCRRVTFIVNELSNDFYHLK